MQDHIGAHLADSLDLQTLAEIAHFSLFHFHRVFQAMTDETLADCVRRMRLEAAAQRLSANHSLSVLRIALDVGFVSPEVFTRAFKAHFGVTPTAWRRGAWRQWADARKDRLRKIHQVLRKQDQAAPAVLGNDDFDRPDGPANSSKGTAMQVELKTLPATQLAYMRHTGPYGDPAIGKLWERFAAWCVDQGFMNPPARDRFGISQDSPEITPADKLRYDCCVAVDDDFKPQGEIGVQPFAGGRYACAPFKGTGADIYAAWMKMYGEWLPQSGWQADDKPGIELYKNGKPDPETGVFECQLCVPVRPM